MGSKNLKTIALSAVLALSAGCIGVPHDFLISGPVSCSKDNGSRYSTGSESNSPYAGDYSLPEQNPARN